MLIDYYTTPGITAPFPVNPIEQDLHMFACTDTNTLEVYAEIDAALVAEVQKGTPVEAPGA